MADWARSGWGAQRHDAALPCRARSGMSHIMCNVTQTPRDIQMSSINTNVAAMTALQTLTQTNKSLTETQNRISTGYRVDDASDNAAYWSIATTMRSDNKALSAVQDALGLGAATVDTSPTQASRAAIEVVDEIKSKLVDGPRARRRPREDPERKSLSCRTSSSSIAELGRDFAATTGSRSIRASPATATPRAIVSSFTRDGAVRFRSRRSTSIRPASKPVRCRHGCSRSRYPRRVPQYVGCYWHDGLQHRRRSTFPL